MALYTMEESTVDNAVQGVCWVEDCGYCTVWYHANDYQDPNPWSGMLSHVFTPPFDRASEAAETEVQEHLLTCHNIEV